MDIIQKLYNNTLDFFLRCKWWNDHVKHEKGRVGSKCDAQFYITIPLGEVNYKTFI